MRQRHWCDFVGSHLRFQDISGTISLSSLGFSRGLGRVWLDAPRDTQGSEGRAWRKGRVSCKGPCWDGVYPSEHSLPRPRGLLHSCIKITRLECEQPSEISSRLYFSDEKTQVCILYWITNAMVTGGRVADSGFGWPWLVLSGFGWLWLALAPVPHSQSLLLLACQ